MKEELGAAGSIVGMIVLAIFFGGIALAIYPGWPVFGVFLNENLLLSKEAPAWVQAIGSIAGIGLAIYVPWSSHRRDVLKSQIEAKIHAAIVVSGFRLNIRPITTCLEAIVVFMSDARNIEEAHKMDSKWTIAYVQALQTRELISNDDLRAIEFAIPKAAAKLAMARGHIRQLAITLPSCYYLIDQTDEQAKTVLRLIDEADSMLTSLDGVLDD